VRCEGSSGTQIITKVKILSVLSYRGEVSRVRIAQGRSEANEAKEKRENRKPKG
jgi:hypothetical protein